MQKPYTVPVTQSTPAPAATLPIAEPKPVPTQEDLEKTMLAAIPRPEGLELKISDEMKGLVRVMAGELVKLYERTK